jgi:hypothetical protein
MISGRRIWRNASLGLLILGRVRPRTLVFRLSKYFSVAFFPRGSTSLNSEFEIVKDENGRKIIPIRSIVLGGR